MSEIQFHQNLYNLIKSEENVSIDSQYIEFDASSSLNSKLENFNVKTEPIGSSKLRVLRDSFDTQIFSSIDDFCTLNQIDSQAEILILEEPAISLIDNITYINFEQSEDDYIFTNSMAYLEFQDFLKRQELLLDDSFHFVDSYNWELRKITFVSLSDKGRLTINYEQGIPLFGRKYDYSADLENFKDCFKDENKTLPKFLKSSLINTASTYSSDTRFQDLFKNLRTIVYKAKQNFEVYLNNLSIDKIKNDYDELKSKYFKNLSDILAKLTNKILALPFGISATLLAVEKLQNIPFFITFLLFAIIFTTVYLSILLKVHYDDTNYVEKIFLNDYTTLMENNFFNKYPEEKELFDEIRNRITKRVDLLKILADAYYWILNITNVIIIGYILNIMNFTEFFIFIVLNAMLITVTVVRNYVIQK